MQQYCAAPKKWSRLPACRPLSIAMLLIRGVHGNGIPRGNGIPMGFPWEWEWKTHSLSMGMGMVMGMGMISVGVGMSKKFMVHKFPFAIRFIILFMYSNFWNAPEIKVFDLLPWYSLHLIVEQQLAYALFTVRFMTAKHWTTLSIKDSLH